MAVDQNKQEYIYQALKEKIFGWQLQPGEKINISQLANELKVSSIPLREVLSRLLVEKLVIFEKNKGYRVSHPLSEEEMLQLTEARILLEGSAIRTMIRLNNIGIVEKLKYLTESMARIDTKESFSNILEFVQMDQQFHRNIMLNGDNSFLVDAHTRLYSHLHIARFYHIRGSVDQEEAVQEHYEIIDAIQTRDVERAQLALANHLKGSKIRLVHQK